MLRPGKGKIAGLILARLKERADEGSDDSDAKGSEVDPGMESAMEDFISAVQSKDAAAAAKALCEAIHCHEGCEES
jgi:hypothetical protein